MERKNRLLNQIKPQTVLLPEINYSTVHLIGKGRNLEVAPGLNFVNPRKYTFDDDM